MQFSEKTKRAALLSIKIARLQRILSERPDDDKLHIALAGLAKRAETARLAFIDFAETASIEVLDYRISQIADSYPIRSVTESLGLFQTSITAIHDAMLHGPKVKARYSAGVEEESTLNLELFYPGSKGFILSIPSQRDLFGGALDRTAFALRDYLDINSADQARDASRHLGLAAVSVLFKWVSSNAKWGNSVDYEWKSVNFQETGQHIPLEKFLLLDEVFKNADEKERIIIKTSGVLVGLDVVQRRFHFAEPDGRSFKGSLHSDYPGGEQSVPHSYLATIQESITRIPATGEEKVTFELISLEQC